MSASSYDCVAYPARPFPETHPDRLAAIGTLFGLKVQPIGQCRILEIGCARGGNLVPMAEQLPGSQFLGIDLSVAQIAEARRLACDIGLKNVQFHAMDVLDFGPEFGAFDYIICHGVFSWVARPVQEKILEIFSARLAPQGVAYVSYNTYPAWHTRGMVREMMCYHASRFADPQTRIREARGLLEFLVRSTPEGTPYGALLKAEAQTLRGKEDGYFFHDELEDINAPIYFAQFAARAEAKGLQYLAEADVSTMWSRHLPPGIAAELERMSAGLVEREQYLDFVRNRAFRNTLLCHANVKVNRELRADALGEFHVVAPLAPVDPAVDIRASHPAKFRHLFSGHEAAATIPLWKAALVCLAETWPGSIPFSQLAARARARANLEEPRDSAGQDLDDRLLGKSILEMHLCGLMELHVIPSSACTQLSERPVARGLARLQASLGGNMTNLRHEVVLVDDFARRILSHLDGTNNRAALRKIAFDHSRESDQAADGSEVVGPALDDRLDQALRALARAALLVG